MDINKLLEEVKSKNVNVKPKGNGTDINALLEEIKYNAPTTNINLSSIYNQSLKTINADGLRNKNNPLIDLSVKESPLNTDINLESLFNQSLKTINNDGSKGKQTIQLPPTQTPELKQQLFKASMESGLKDNAYFTDPNYDFEGYKKYYDSLPFTEKIKNANASPLEVTGYYGPEKYGKMLSDSYNEQGIGGDVGAGAYKGILGFKNMARGWGNAITGDLGGSSNYFKESPLDKSFVQARSELMDNRSFIRNLPENLSMVGTQLLPTLATGGTAGIAIAAANAGGQNTQQALDSGATSGQATWHGLITGTTEALLERALGFKFGSAGSKVAKGSALKITGDAARNAKSIAKEFLKKSAGEGLEEVLINPVTQASKKLLYDDSVSVNMNPYAENNAYGDNGLFPVKQMLNDGALGAIMGGILSGVNIPNQVQYAKMIEQDMGKNFEVDLSIGLNMPETSQSYEIANQLANQNFDTVTEESYSNYKKVLGEDIQTLNKVAQENTMLPQNIQNITESPINQQEMQPNFNETLPQQPELDLTQSPLQDVKTSSQVIESPLNQNVVSQNQAPVINNSNINNIPMNERNFSDVGNKKVNSYQYDNPNVKPYYQNLANFILNEEFITAESGFSGEANRSMQGQVMKKLKETGLPYKDIKSGLELIIKDEGSENVARSKKVELVLDDLISNGFRLKDGTKLNPDTDYLKIKSQIDNTQYVEPNINNDLPVIKNNTAPLSPTNQQPNSQNREIASTMQPNEMTSTTEAISNYVPQGKVDSKGIASDEVELEQQIKQGGLSWDLQRFAEEKLDKIKILSKFMSNTLKNNPNMTYNEKKLFNEAVMSYDLVSEKESLAEAKERLERDFEGEVYELSEKESFVDGKDFDTAMGILSVYKEEGRKTGNYSKFLDWAKMIQVKASTSAGQIVQAHAKYSRTPEGVLRGTQRLIDSIEKDIKENNPNRIKDIEEQTDAVNEILKEVDKQVEKDVSDEILKDELLDEISNDIESEVEKDVSDEILKDEKTKRYTKKENKEEDDVATLLAEKIIRNTNKTIEPKKQVEKDVIDMMVNELYLKHKETLDNDSTISESTKYKEIAKAIKEREIAGDVWVQAKEIVREKFKDNTEAQDILDKYFDTGTRPPFSQKLLNQTIKDAMKSMNIKLSDMVKEYYAKGKKQRGELVDFIIKKSGLSGKDAKVLNIYIQTKIEQMKIEYSEKYLEQVFKAKLPPVIKDGKIIKDIEALFNTKSFDNEKYANLVNDKLSSKVKQQIKNAGINMNELARESISKKEFSEELFLNSLRSKIRLSPTDETILLNTASSTFKTLVNEYRIRILNNMFKEKTPNVKKIMMDKITELSNLGAYTTKNLKNVEMSDKILMKTIKTALDSKGIKFSDMVNEYYSKGKKQRGELVKHIVEKSGLDGKDAEVLTRYVQSKIKEMKKEYSEKYLETAFKEKLPSVKKDGKIIKDIEALFNNGAFDNDKYSSRVIDKLSNKIRLQLKRSGINMTELVKKSIKKTELKSDIFLDSIRSKLELSLADETTLVSVAQETFNEVVEEYKDRILSNKFKVKDKAIKKSMQSKVMELINLGAYTRESIRDAIKEKEGLPVLNNDDIGKILRLAEIEESQDGETGISQLSNTIINTIMANKIPVETRDKALALLRNNMLSATTSHLKNISGNLILNAPIIGIENFKDYYAGAFIDMVTSKLTGMERDVLFSPIVKTKAYVKGMASGVKRLKSDFTASRSNVDVLTKRFIDEGLNEEMAKSFAEILAPEKPSENLKGWDKIKDHKRYLFEKINGKYNNIDTSRVSSNYDLRNSRVFKSDTLNTYDSYVKTFLRFGDVPFYEAAREMRMAELKKIKKTNIATEEMNLNAELFALETVFQNNSDIRQRIVKIKDAMGFVGDIMMPFTQTPANLFDKLIDYTPAGMVRGLLDLGKVKKGTFNKHLFVSRLSRSLTGTSAIVLFAALAKMGILSLTGATDRREKVNAMQKTQFQRYSIKLKLGDEDYYFSYETFPPIGSLMAIAVTMNEEIERKGMSWDAVLKGGYAASDMLINSSMLQGILSLVTNFNLAGSLTKTLENTISQTNPNILKRWTKALDPSIRETYDKSKFQQGINKYIAGIPFASKMLHKKVDVFGKENEWYNGLNNTFLMMFNPVSTTKFKPTEVQKEIYDVFLNSDEVGVLPNVADNKITYNDKKGVKQEIQLDTEQYIKYQRLMGEYVQGKVTEIIKSPRYIDKGKRFGYKYKVDVLSGVMRDSKEFAKDTILKEILGG